MKVALRTVSLQMANYDPPHKTLFFVCCSTVAALIANQADLLGNPDAHLAELSHQELIEDFERYLASNEDHPWCGTGRLEDTQVGYLVIDGAGDAT